MPTYYELADQHLAFARSYQRGPANIKAVLCVYARLVASTLSLDLPKHLRTV